MITYFQAGVLGLLQGVSELFPISSLGHSVILPSLLGWNIHQNDPFFLTFLVATHFVTALVLLGFYWQDWVKIVKGMWHSLVEREVSSKNIYGKLGWLLFVGTIPAGVLGLLFQDSLRALFASALYASIFLIGNGLLLWGAELLRLRANKKESESEEDISLAKVSWVQSFFIGAVQAIALIPGFSRSGASMAGGLLSGLTNKEAARFSFLMATPIIGAAALLKLPELFSASNQALRGPAFVGAVLAGITAYLSVRFLTKFFETNSLKPFAVYCLSAGVILSLYFIR